jgi:hydrogenase maturation protein HypF
MPASEHSPESPLRLRLCIRGAVQGVGFRPFVYRLATELGLPGWVNNSPQGVFIEVEGPPTALQIFQLRIEREKPPHAVIYSLEPAFLDPVGYSGFEIRASSAAGAKSALVLPDLATCPDCLRDLFDAPEKRRRGRGGRGRVRQPAHRRPRHAAGV